MTDKHRLLLSSQEDPYYDPYKWEAVQWDLHSDLGHRAEAYPEGSCTQIVYTSAPKYLYIGTTLRPKYIVFGYMDP